MTKNDEGLYLEDLQVGQRFESGPHTLDAEQIKRFAADFDPQPFHTDEEAAKIRSSARSPRAAGTPLPSPCAC